MRKEQKCRIWEYKYKISEYFLNITFGFFEPSQVLLFVTGLDPVRHNFLREVGQQLAERFSPLPLIKGFTLFLHQFFAWFVAWATGLLSFGLHLLDFLFQLCRAFLLVNALRCVNADAFFLYFPQILGSFRLQRISLDLFCCVTNKTDGWGRPHQTRVHYGGVLSIQQYRCGRGTGIYEAELLVNIFVIVLGFCKFGSCRYGYIDLLIRYPQIFDSRFLFRWDFFVCLCLNDATGIYSFRLLKDL